MKVLLITGMVLIFWTGNTFAQEEVEKLKGKKALSFSFQSLNIGKFKGGIGGRKWLSENLVGFVSVNTNYINSEVDEVDKRTNLSLGATIGFEKHRGFVDKVSPYWGFEFGIGYILSKFVSYGGSIGPRENQVTENSFGADFILGVEYRVRKRISLTGQYNLGIRFTIGNRKYTIQEIKQESSTSSFTAGISVVSLILSIYF